VALLLVGFLAAFTAKMAPMEFVAHQSEPTVAKVAEFQRARAHWNGASSARNDFNRVVPVGGPDLGRGGRSGPRSGGSALL
jgi:hypothetical protein